MVDLLQCDIGSGLILMDRDRLAAFKATDTVLEDIDPEALFSLAVDPYGETDQNEESLSPQEWRSIWREVTRPLVSMVNRGELAFFVLNGGDYWADLDLSRPRPERQGLVESRMRLDIPSGVLVIERPFPDLPFRPHFPDHPPLRSRELAVEPGWYVVSVLAGTPRVISPLGRFTWVYGTADEPVFHVRLERSDADVPPRDELPHLEYFPPPDDRR